MDLTELQKMIDVSEIVGKPVEVDKYTTLVPISKVSIGYVGGDGDVKQKGDSSNPNGINVKGFGMTVLPLGLFISGEKKTFIKLDESFTEDKWVSLVKNVLSAYKK